MDSFKNVSALCEDNKLFLERIDLSQVSFHLEKYG